MSGKRLTGINEFSGNARKGKATEKLVLLPDTWEKNREQVKGSVDVNVATAPTVAAGGGIDTGTDTFTYQFLDDESQAFGDDSSNVESLLLVAKDQGISFAERLPKAYRSNRIARVTAYCTAKECILEAAKMFCETYHAGTTRLFDDCLIVTYRFPLVNGAGGFRVRSSPCIRKPSNNIDTGISTASTTYRYDDHSVGSSKRDITSKLFVGDLTSNSQLFARKRAAKRSGRMDPIDSCDESSITDYRDVGEVLVFSYGIFVFWNFSESQEKNILADINFSFQLTGLQIVMGQHSEEDIEIEEFHFEYNSSIARPRVYNDMITLKTRDHLTKLAISHAIAQSTLLQFFEERMHETMQETENAPRMLAQTGTLRMNRGFVNRTVGRLFKSRVDVNLSSNVLDIPNFFWDTEPTLHPLYYAVREYLEIEPRIQVLNEKCQVFLDLASVFSSSLAHEKMTVLSKVIIFLIILSIIVTCSEVFLRSSILTKLQPKRLRPLMSMVRNDVDQIGLST